LDSFIYKEQNIKSGQKEKSGFLNFDGLM
jgi:hypothetical protein